MKKLRDMRLIGQTINVHCGLVTGAGKRVYGCGKEPSQSGFNEFCYKLDDYELWSTVSLCPNCEKTLGYLKSQLKD